MAASSQISSFCLSSSSLPSSSKRIIIKSSINVPKLPRGVLPLVAPTLPSRKLFEELNGGFTNTSTIKIQQDSSSSSDNNSKATAQLYAILEAVADRVEMHHNVGQQRDNWNTLLLNSINMITLTATAISGLAPAAGQGAPLLALKLSSTLLFSAATGMLVVMNKIQPSQLAEEQRNATRLFKQLKSHIETTIAIGNPNEEDVKDAMKKVLALDRAYPLPLLGAMIEKFPSKFEPSVWWPHNGSNDKSSPRRRRRSSSVKFGNNNNNGWSEGLEREIKDVLEVVKRKDMEDYERLGNIVLRINKSLAIAGPLLSGIAAMGSLLGSPAVMPVMAGALATAVNAFQHGGQLGMVFEMYRSCGGFFKLLEHSIQDTVEEGDVEERENGELFEMKLALKLGRSISQLRDLARKSAYARVEGSAVDEFASKLF